MADFLILVAESDLQISWPKDQRASEPRDNGRIGGVIVGGRRSRGVRCHDRARRRGGKLTVHTFSQRSELRGRSTPTCWASCRAGLSGRPRCLTATLVETHKQEALQLQKVQGIPAALRARGRVSYIRSFGTATFLTSSCAVGQLPAGVEKVMLRSGGVSAGVTALLRRGTRRAVRGEVRGRAVDVTQFRRAVSEVAEHGGRCRSDRVRVGELRPIDSKNSPEYRFIAAAVDRTASTGRRRRWNFRLPAMERPVRAGTRSSEW